MNIDFAPRVGGEFIPTRQSLLSRLKNADDQESWNEFFNTYWKLIYRTALRAGLTETECQDVVQETVIGVCRKIPEFKYDPKRGSFKSWLLRLTYWRIRDQYDKRLPRVIESNAEGDLVESMVDPKSALEAMWEAEWEKNLFEAAVERAKRAVDPKCFQIFDLFVLQHWPAEKVRTLLNISSAQVYLAKHRVLSLLKKEMQTLERKCF
jgi:RNA polymerase sigma-70 factor (ECF subfamily)